MTLVLGQKLENFTAATTCGPIDFYEYVDPKTWAILFSHPQDFTPVCTTELAELVNKMSEFDKRNIKTLCLSCDPLEHHHIWAKDILHVAGSTADHLPFPIIADPKGKLALRMGILDEKEVDRQGNLLTCRAVIVIGPGRLLKLLQLYPATTGRNFDEILRAIDSLQLTEDSFICTPVNWKNGEQCIISHKMDPEEAKVKFPGIQYVSLPSGMQYLKKADFSICKATKEVKPRNENKTVLHKPYRTHM